MERLVLNILQPWMEPKLPLQQAGFRHHRSCETQVMILTEEAMTAIEEQQVRMAVFLDYSAAYDRVSIKKLLAKLGNLNCSPKLLLWLRSFLNDRRAHCRWDDGRSKSRVMPNGLPQGSTLAPILWNAYIYDL